MRPSSCTAKDVWSPYGPQVAVLLEPIAWQLGGVEPGRAAVFLLGALDLAEHRPSSSRRRRRNPA
jgi:hypothetical protein